MDVQIEFAHDVLARRLRDEAEARFDAIRSRTDLRACARLHALAAYIEADTQTAGLFGFLTPSLAPREFPSVANARALVADREYAELAEEAEDSP